MIKKKTFNHNTMLRTMIRRLTKRGFSSATRNPLKPFGGAIQYISDIHFDRNPFSSYQVIPAHLKNEKNPRARILVVAGDLGNAFCPTLKSFFEENCDNYETVIYVPGNHEYYTDPALKSEGFGSLIGSYQDTQHHLRRLEDSFSNLKVLMKNSYDLKLNGEDVKILGCTLWSQIPDQYTEYMNKFADYQKIMFEGQPLNPNITNRIHSFEKEWLERELREVQKSSNPPKVLVVTHHAPLVHKTCHPRYLFDQDGNEDRLKWKNYAFSSNLSQLMGGPLVAWIFGHTHYRVCFQHHSGTVIAQNHLGFVKSPYQSIRTL